MVPDIEWKNDPFFSIWASDSSNLPKAAHFVYMLQENDLSKFYIMKDGWLKGKLKGLLNYWTCVINGIEFKN